MADIVLDVQSAPSTPSAGQATIYVDTSLKRLSSKDDAGTVVNYTGLAVPVTVPNGGTGATTLTGILQGNGTSAVTAIAIPSDATKFLDGTGAFSTPTSGGGYDYVQMQSFS